MRAMKLIENFSNSTLSDIHQRKYTANIQKYIIIYLESIRLFHW